MTKCDNCDIDAFMPITTTELTRENVIETHFCSIECLIVFFKEVLDQ